MADPWQYKLVNKSHIIKRNRSKLEESLNSLFLDTEKNESNLIYNLSELR